MKRGSSDESRSSKSPTFAAFSLIGAMPIEYVPGPGVYEPVASAITNKGEFLGVGTIRIIDIAFAGKSGDGDVVAFELTELDPEVREGLERIGLEVGGLFNADDVVAAAEKLDPNSSVALIAWENVWARNLERAVRDADGTVLDLARLPHEVVQEAREWALAQV